MVMETGEAPISCALSSETHREEEGAERSRLNSVNVLTAPSAHQTVSSLDAGWHRRGTTLGHVQIGPLQEGHRRNGLRWLPRDTFTQFGHFDHNI